MWLTLLAALFDDTAADTARRAALRETARRLGLPATDTPVPGTRARLDALIRRVQQGGDRQRGVVALRYLVKMTWDDNPSRSVLDAEETYPLGTRLVLPVSGRRGRLDPYLTWLFTVSQSASEPLSWDEIQAAMPEVMDWADATRPNLSAMTWDDALAASEAWHAQFSLHRSDDAPSPGVVVAQFSDGARIERLLSRDNLSDEGDAMGHCVGSHYASVARGDSQVFSYRDPNGMPKATWEVELHGKNANAFEFGRVTDLEGPSNEEVEDRSACVRVPAWLLTSRIAIGEFAPKVGEAPTSDRIVPNAWLSDPVPLTEEERFLDQQVLDAIEPTRFFGPPSNVTATDYMNGVLSHLQEQIAVLEGDLRLLALAQHLDDEDELRCHRLEAFDGAWTPERVLQTVASLQTATSMDERRRQVAELVAVGQAAGMEVNPNDDPSIGHFLYVVKFAAERALRYAKERAEIAEALSDNQALSRPAEWVVREVYETVEAQEKLTYVLLKNALTALNHTLNLSTTIQKPDDYSNIDEKSFGIAEFHGPRPDSAEAFGDHDLTLEVNDGKVRYHVYWTTPTDGREQTGVFTHLLPALAHANLLISIKDWFAQIQKADATLAKHGLVTRLDMASTYGTPGAVLAASKAAGLPVPPMLARRFSTP